MAVCEAFINGNCTAGFYCRKDHPKTRPSTNSSNDSREVRRASQTSDRVFVARPNPPSVLGKRAVPGAVTATSTPRVVSEPSTMIPFKPPTGPRSAMPQPRRAISSSMMPPPPKPAAAPTSVPREVMPFIESTVFDNTHAHAPASLETMIGQPFHELERHTWLCVRPDFSDIQKLLTDSFLLRKHDNSVSDGPDRAKLGGKDIRGEWKVYVLTAAKRGLLPFEPGADGVNTLIQETVLDEAGKLDENQVSQRYSDVRMPLQMRVFASQVMGYDLPPSTISKEMWKDLLKYEMWEWEGAGFEWKKIFG